MKTLITGASGYLGQALLKYLASHNKEIDLVLIQSRNNLEIPNEIKNVKIEVINLINESEVRRLFTENKLDKIVHLAGQSSPRGNSLGFIDNNIKVTANLLEHCQNNTDFIFASSILVYSPLYGGHLENDVLIPNTLYGASKAACENLINVYRLKNKIRPRILRLCGVLGPNITHGRLSQVNKDTKSITLYGQAPGDYIPYCHVNDTISAIVKAMDSARASITANICPQDYISLQEALQLVAPDLQIDWVAQDPSQPPAVYQCYNERANYELDWSPTYTTREVIEIFAKSKNSS